MPNPTIRIHDVENNKIVDREMTNNELKDYETWQLTQILEKESQETKALAKTALLKRLGITAEEATLLLS
jgi:hypothetical protein